MARSQTHACRRCLRRTRLLELLAGHLDRARGELERLLEIGDEDELLAALAGARRASLEAELGEFGGASARERVTAAGLVAVCGCDERFPASLRDLPTPPAVVHVAPADGGLARLGQLLAQAPVAIVGARQADAYGRGVTHTLAQGCAGAGMTVLSGMALGIDGAAHSGALERGGPTLAVLAGGADRPYPASHQGLYRRILEAGVVISEAAPGTAARRWMFPARNRLIAALSAMTVVAQARSRSGSLVTARWAGRLGRRLGAIPGPITSELSTGPHDLLAGGQARLVAGIQDVLDEVYGAGAVIAASSRPRPADPRLAALLDALAEGEVGAAAFARAGLPVENGLSALAALELDGLIARGPGGRYTMRG